MRRKFVFLVLTILISCPICHGEGVIWRVSPQGSRRVSDSVTNSLGPGGGGVVQSRYALAQVFVEPDSCDDCHPGIVNQITTFFEDDAAVPFGSITGFARLNVFVVQGANSLPTFNQNPDFGIEVPVIFTQITKGGMNVIEVRAMNLADLMPPIVIEQGVRFYIGLTPVFTLGDEPFGGNHLANTVGIGLESPSAVRMTFPPPDTDWDFAIDPADNSPLFATIEILGGLLGDVNHDAVVDLLDVAPFVNLLTTGGFLPEADINQDGVVDLLDVDPFIDLISGF